VRNPETKGLAGLEAIYLASVEPLRLPLNRYWLMRVAEASPLVRTLVASGAADDFMNDLSISLLVFMSSASLGFLRFGRSNCEALLSTAEKYKTTAKKRSACPA